MNNCSVREIPPEYLIYKLNIMKKTVLIIAAVAVISLFFSKGFGMGFFVGGLISLANFSLLAKYILKMRDFSSGRAKRYITGKFLVLYAIMAAALFIAVSKGMPVFVGTASGLLAVKVAIFLDGVIIKYDKPG